MKQEDDTQDIVVQETGRNASSGTITASRKGEERRRRKYAASLCLPPLVRSTSSNTVYESCG